jgi:uncharacterized damage-inducible protein DinB
VTRPEPWLRGALPDVDPLLAPVLFALQQAREDLDSHTAGLSTEAIWSRPNGVTSLGFHLRHIAGSLDRLTSYLLGRELTEEQLAFLHREKEPGASRDELLADIGRALDATEDVIRSLDTARLTEPRTVGRKRLPTTIIGLAIHIAEHTQRHVGQAITMCKLLGGT